MVTRLQGFEYQFKGKAISGAAVYVKKIRHGIFHAFLVLHGKIKHPDIGTCLLELCGNLLHNGMETIRQQKEKLHGNL